MPAEAPLARFLLLSRNLLSAPETEWDSLFAERQAILDGLDDQALESVSQQIVTEIAAIESQLQARIAKETRSLKGALVSGFCERQQAAQYQRPTDLLDNSIEC